MVRALLLRAHMNIFDHATEKANVWVKDMMRELATDDPRHAYHALSASLQALRDRVSVDEAAQLAAQLPVLVRGVFYEGWRPSATPMHLRRPEQLLALVEERLGDGGQPIDPERALGSTFEVLRKHLSPGAIASLAHLLPRSLAELAH
jgi:uncharacterized protein (DUF2267 family)